MKKSELTTSEAFSLGREFGLNLTLKTGKNEKQTLAFYPEHLPQFVSPELSKALHLPKLKNYRVSLDDLSNPETIQLEQEGEELQELSSEAKNVFYAVRQKLSAMKNQPTRETASLNAYLLAKHLDYRAAYLTEQGKPTTAWELYTHGYDFRYEDDASSLQRPYATLYQQEAEPATHLIAYHNTTPDNLMKSIELGGFPVPSLAVTRSDIPYTKFGRITLIGSREMADPQENNHVFSIDGYTVRVPKKDYPPIRSKNERAFYKKFEKSFDGMGARLSAFDFEMQTRSSQNFYETFCNEYAVERYYLEHVQNLKIDYEYTELYGQREIDWPKTRKPYQELLGDHNPAYQKWLDQEYEKLAGEPRIKLGRKFVPYTLENVTKVMLKQKGTAVEETSVYGRSKASARLGTKYRTLDRMRKDAENLVLKEEVEAFNKERDDLCSELQKKLFPFYDKNLSNNEFDAMWDANDKAMEALSTARGIDVQSMKSHLSYYGFKNVDDSTAELAVKTRDILQKAVTSYFEAKPQRAIQLSDFRGAILPQDTSEDIQNVLQQAGVPIRTYDPMKHGDREAQMEAFQKEHPDVLFQTQYGVVKGAVERDLKKIVHIFHEADASTCLHELSHTFLMDLEHDAAWEKRQGKAGEASQDLATICDWASFQKGASKDYVGTPWEEEFAELENKILKARKDLEEAQKEAKMAHQLDPQAEDPDSIYLFSISDEVHRLEEQWMQERFARGFEQYIQKGTAPTKLLANVFQKFKKAMKHVYQAFCSGGSRAPKEVEAVMGGMLGAKMPKARNSKQQIITGKHLQEILSEGKQARKSR